MQEIRKFLMESKNISKSAVIWNALSAMLNSFQTMVLLLVITRVGNVLDASVFVMAYAVGNLMLNIGKYGVRQFQVTDVKEKYQWKEYLSARICSVILMLVVSIGYILYNSLLEIYTIEKSIIIFLICFMKTIEAYEDVFHGRMQQKGRLDIAGKILAIRFFVFIIGFISMYILSESLVVSVIVNVIITLFLALFLNGIVFDEFNNNEKEIKNTQWKQIMIDCFPLCICMCLMMYIANAPKYIIDTIVDEQTQICFNIAFMPVFVISLLANFIFQPILKRMGELWNDNKVLDFIKKIISLVFIIIIGDFVITLIGGMIGTKILGFLYDIELTHYNNTLMLLLIAGGMIALLNLFIMLLTTVRYQKYIIGGYILTASGLFLLGKRILVNYGIDSLTKFFLLMLFGLMIYCVVLLVFGIKKQHN